MRGKGWDEMNDYEKRCQVEEWNKEANRIQGYSGRMPDPSDLADKYGDDLEWLLYYEQKAEEEQTEAAFEELRKAQEKFKKDWPYAAKTV